MNDHQSPDHTPPKSNTKKRNKFTNSDRAIALEYYYDDQNKSKAHIMIVAGLKKKYPTKYYYLTESTFKAWTQRYKQKDIHIDAI